MIRTVNAEDVFQRRVCVTLNETRIRMLDNLVYAAKRAGNARASRSMIVANLIDNAVPAVPAELEL